MQGYHTLREPNNSEHNTEEEISNTCNRSFLCDLAGGYWPFGIYFSKTRPNSITTYETTVYILTALNLRHNNANLTPATLLLSKLNFVQHTNSKLPHNVRIQRTLNLTDKNPTKYRNSENIKQIKHTSGCQRMQNVPMRVSIQNTEKSQRYGLAIRGFTL